MLERIIEINNCFIIGIIEEKMIEIKKSNKIELKIVKIKEILLIWQILQEIEC